MRGSIGFLTGTPVGHYRVAAATGLTTGLAAGNPIFSARWGGVTPMRPLILRLEVFGALITPFTAAQEVSAAAFIARGFTAADTGGTPLTLSGTNAGVQNSLADVPPTCTINVATTGTLTAGTRTLDANPFLYIAGAQTLAAANAGSLSIYDEFHVQSDQEFPFNLQNAQALAANAEGIVVTVPTAQGAGGTVRYVIEMEWLEYGFGPGSAASGFIG